MLRTFSGKCVVVTGAAQGIGFEVARQFVQAGASVCVVDVQEERAREAASNLSELAERPNTRVIALSCDVSDESSVEQLFRALETKFGALDVLVNAAGVLHVAPIEKTDEQAFARVMSVNLTGTFLTMKHAAPLLRLGENPAIVNFSSLAGKTGLDSLSAYCASKAAVISLTHVAAIEFAPAIRVNAVLPGVVDTEMQRREYEIISEQTGQSEEEIRQQWVDEVPLKRLQETSEIADAVLFLAGANAHSVTGQSLAVNGGLRMD